MGIGWFLGGLFFILHSILCFWIGYKKPEKMLKLVKMKLGKKSTDELAVKLCYAFVGIDIIVAVALFYFGYINR